MNRTRHGWIAAALVFGLGLSSAPGRAQSPVPARIRLAFPTAEDIVYGPSILRATVEPPGTPAVRVEFFVDGVPVCRALAEPYECAYDAPRTAEPREVLAIATLQGGRRLSSERVRTKGLEGIVESASAEVVYVPVLVTDRRGGSVPDLQQSDFQVLEDDKPQVVSYFQAKSVHVDLAVAIDISESMTKVMPDVMRAANTFLDTFTASDNVSVLVFNHTAYVVAQTGTDPVVRRTSLSRVSPSGGTALYDAILAAASRLGTGISRRAIVLFSDVDDTHSQAPIAAVDAKLRGSDAALFPLIREGPGTSKNSRDLITAMATRSGGQAFTIGDADDLRTAFSAIRDYLGKHYLLAYQPQRSAPDGEFHRITVKVPTRPNVIVRARDGYLNVR